MQPRPLTSAKRARPVDLGPSTGPQPPFKRQRILSPKNLRDCPDFRCRRRKMPLKYLKTLSSRIGKDPNAFKLLDAQAKYYPPAGVASRVEAVEYTVRSLATKSTYFVEIQRFPRCSCPNFRELNHHKKQKKLCKHIMWVLLYVLRVDELQSQQKKYPLQYQIRLEDDQLDAVFTNRSNFTHYPSEIVASEEDRIEHARFLSSFGSHEAARQHFVDDCERQIRESSERRQRRRSGGRRTSYASYQS